MPGDAFLFWAQVSDASTGLLALASEPQLCCLSGAPIQPKDAEVSLAPLCASLRAVYKRLLRDFAKSPPPGMCPDPQKCSRQCEDALRKWLADKTRNGLRAGGFFCRAFFGEVQLVLLGPCILRAKLPCSVKSNDRLLKILNLIREKLVRVIIVNCASMCMVKTHQYLHLFLQSLHLAPPEDVMSVDSPVVIVPVWCCEKSVLDAMTFVQLLTFVRQQQQQRRLSKILPVECLHVPVQLNSKEVPMFETSRHVRRGCHSFWVGTVQDLWTLWNTLYPTELI